VVAYVLQEEEEGVHQAVEGYDHPEVVEFHPHPVEEECRHLLVGVEYPYLLVEAGYGLQEVVPKIDKNFNRIKK